MSDLKYKPLSEFLKERKGRFKPNDPAVVKLKRLEKIDFTGQIHISEKSSKTDMIIINPGDLVISGINVAKGALAVYEGNEPITATIHFSSYKFDKEKIDISFLKRFLKSPAFISNIQNQVKGGIKTEIKPKHLLPLKVKIPTLTEQQKISKHFDSIENSLTNLSTEIQNQSTILTSLRQSILQEAIEGKLTSAWRKEHPVVKGNPDYDAEALLEKIKAEKERLIKEGRIKKQKPLPPIKSEEMPFELPNGWVWTMLGEVGEGFQYGSSTKSSIKGKCPVLRMGNIQSGKIDWKNLVYTNNKDEIKQFKLKQNDLLFNRSNSRELVGKTALFDGKQEAIFAGYLIRFSPLLSLPKYFNIMMSSTLHREWCNQNKTDAIGQSNINATKLQWFLAPLPPLSEQQAIVSRVEKLLAIIDELEKQVARRKEHAEQLMQSVLREAFRGDKK